MNCSQAIKTIILNLKEADVCLFTTGLISRRAFSIKDRVANFYMLGSMGLISSVGLGIALNTDKRVFLFDGDGSVLMDLGTMAMIATQKPKNLFHIVFDNETYESTGGQPTISSQIDLSNIAESMGYSKVFNFKDIKQLQASIAEVLLQEGPIFILLKLDVVAGEEQADRVSISPPELSLRIKNILKENSG